MASQDFNKILGRAENRNENQNMVFSNFAKQRFEREKKTRFWCRPRVECGHNAEINDSNADNEDRLENQDIDDIMKIMSYSY